MPFDGVPAKHGDVGLLPKQIELVRNRGAKIIIFRGGYRSGKTTGLIAKAIDNGRRHWPWPVLAVEPSFPMIRSVFVESAIECCEKWKLHCRWQESKKTITIGRRNPIRIWCRSADSPRSLEGLTVGSLVGDEWELWAIQALKVAMARVSQGPKEAQQIVLGGTPEGFGPGWALLEKKPKKTTAIIVSRTVDNFTLRGDYDSDMRSRLSDEEATEKLDGVRTMPSGRVYTRFVRDLHVGRPCLDVRRARLEVWADFNEGLMAWAFVLVDDSQHEKRFHVVGEMVVEHTDSQKQAIAAREWIEQWQRRERRPVDARGVVVVCDASGKERSAITPATHVRNIKDAGFRPKYGSENPRVDDRVASVQKVLGGQVGAEFLSPRLTFDPAAEYMARCIEQQPKGHDGKPSKDPEIGLDHGADAIGYGIMHRDPGFRPSTAFIEQQNRERWERSMRRGAR